MNKEGKNINKFPKIHILFSNFIFLAGIICSILVLSYAVYKIYNPTFLASSINSNANTFYFSFAFLALLLVVLFFLCLRLNDNLKINLSLTFFIIFLFIFVSEVYLGIQKYSSNTNLTTIDRIPLNVEKAKKLGINYDPRTRNEFLEDISKQYQQVYPNFIPSKLMKSEGISHNNSKIFPLGGISDIITTFENESGYFPIIKTDRFGFNNENNLFIENEIDLMLVGDSFVEGYSVQQNQSLQAKLNYLDFKTVSVGKGGNGPLIELATLREYGVTFKPKNVLWFYYRNDIRNLEKELNSKILQKYLVDSNFTQNLVNKQNEIDLVLKNYLQEKQKKIKNKKNIFKRNWTEINSIINILKLTNLRILINITPFQPEISYDKEISEFKNILFQAKNLVNEWNGELYFVYLPSYEFYLTGKRNSLRKNILLNVSELNIPIIDVYSDVFEPHENPSSLFPTTFCPPCHYNEEGYKLIADSISNYFLERENF